MIGHRPVMATFAALALAAFCAPAWAGEVTLAVPTARTAWIDVAAPADDTIRAGSWVFGPVAGIRPGRDAISGGDYGDVPVAVLGFRGLAKVDSRLGVLYSRLSLSFEHSIADRGRRLAGGGPTGYYADRSALDVMTLDAAFALRMSDTMVGLLDYGAEMEFGSVAEHRAVVTLRVAF